MTKKFEAVISGMAGMFPECSSIRELEEKLYLQENLVTRNESQGYTVGDVVSPPYTGSVKNIEMFDQTFFGIHKLLAGVINCYNKQCLSLTYEALCDAGLSYEEIRGKKIAVFTTNMISDSDGTLLSVPGDSTVNKQGAGLLAFASCMNANRVSYFFNLIGPSAHTFSWTGALANLQSAVRMVESGEVRTAIVGGFSKLYLPSLSLNYDGLRYLNKEGKTKSFSADAEGYNRSDGMVVIILQRAQDALRSYGSVVKAYTASMSSNSHLSDPHGFGEFIKEFYSDLDIKGDNLGYVECDGSASKFMDAMELNSLAEVLCKKRSRPLLVSSCKSKVGHCESASGMVSLVHALLALKHGYIPPTLHYTAPNPDVPALLKGDIKVVTDKTPLEGDYVGVTSLGLFNDCSHVLIKKNPKKLPPRPEDYFPVDGIPRLFLLTGRVPDDVEAILAKVLEKPVDENYYAINHHLFKGKVPHHLHRGVAIKGEDKKKFNISKYSEVKREIWYVFTGMGAQWPCMGTGLMKIPIIRRSLEKSAKVLATKGVDLMHILTSPDPDVFEDILCSFVGIAAIQVALVDFLEDLGVKPDGIVGHSTGEIGCAYADKCLTAEQTVLAAYARGKASNEATLIKGMMAAVGMGYNQIKDLLPEGVYVACRNSSTSCTLSGPTELMEEYVAKLKNDGVFAKLVNVSNIAYHTKYIKPAAPYLQRYLDEFIPMRTLRSKKWISSSVPAEKWNSEEGLYCSANYFVNNLLNNVLFEDATKFVPENSICIEIAPHGLLQAIIKKSLPNCIHVPLTDRKDPGTFFLIEAVGSLFMEAVDVDVSRIYPPVEFPVPRETDFMDVCTWDTSYSISFLEQQNDMYNRLCGLYSKYSKVMTMRLQKYVYVQGNQFQGVSYFPRSIFLEYLLDMEMQTAKETQSNFASYSFQNIKFCQDLQFSMSDYLETKLLIQPGSKAFEINYNMKSIVTTYLSGELKPLPTVFSPSDFLAHQQKRVVLSQNEIYGYLEEMGYNLLPPFRSITELTIYNKGFSAKLEWTNKFEIFLDLVFKIIELYSSLKSDHVVVLDSIEELLVDHKALPKTEGVIEIFYDEALSALTADGIRIFRFRTKPLSHCLGDSIEMKSGHFLPYSTIDLKVDFIHSCLEIISENSKCVKLVVDQSSSTCKSIAQSIDSKNQTFDYQMNIVKKETILDKECVLPYLIVGDRGSLKDVERLMSTEVPFYFIYTGNRADLRGKLSHLVCIIEQQKDKRTIGLYKQKKTSIEGCELIDMGDARMSGEVTMPRQSNKTSTCFHVYRYRFLSEVKATLQLPFYKASNTRLVFLDASCAKLNANSDFYKQQIMMDLKVNIVQGGVWGSLRQNSAAQLLKSKILNSCPLSSIRCESVDLEVIGVNLQSLVYPDKYRKIGVIDYSGVKNGKQVFGLGRLVGDNFLETDDALCWEKPNHWSMEDAATVPLFYFMAYDILKVRKRDVYNQRESLLIHAGHTPFSQVIINVALSLKMNVFTSCNSKHQKQFILNKFPQVKADNIFLIERLRDDSFANCVLSATDGEGPHIVIDNLEDDNIRTATCSCGSIGGLNYLLTTDNMDNNFIFGYSLIGRGFGFIGYNPEMIFDIPEEDKRLIGKLIQEGIKCRVVQPLARHSLPTALPSSQVADTIVLKSREDFPVKYTMTVKNQVKQVPATNRQIMDDKSYLIIGDDFSLWFDLVKWLLSKGVISVHVLLNQSKVPHNVNLRFNELVLKHKHKALSVGELDKYNSVERWSELIKSLQPTLDTVFCINKGVEKELSNIDKALRSSSKDTCLVTLGSQWSPVIEQRHTAGLRTAAFILKGDKLSNLSVINCLDNWTDKFTGDEQIIEVKEVSSASAKLACIIPQSGMDLVELTYNASQEPDLVEIATRCTRDEHAHDLDPVVIFPGLLINETRDFASQLIYPTYLATYPYAIKSLDQLASAFVKILLERFGQNLFTLVAEGWAGPLVLTVAKLLEKQGKSSSVILLNAAPQTVTQWSKQRDNYIGVHLPSQGQCELSTDILRSNLADISKSVSRESGNQLREEDVQAGLEILINRLNAIEHFCPSNYTLNTSSVHLFSCTEIHHKSLIQLSDYFFRQCLVKSSGYNMLEEPSLIIMVNELVVQEIRMRAKRQEIKNISCLSAEFDQV